jgi:uncharacterized protein YrrD
MLINQKQFKKVIVETQSGQVLGKLNDFEIETDTGIIEKYFVSAKIPLAGLFEGKIIIDRQQVISFDQKKMIVEDTAVKKEAKQKIIKELEKVEGAEPAITSEKS